MDMVLDLVRPERLQRLIDDPIEKAAAKYDFDRDRPVDHQYFLKVVTGLVSHLHRSGLPIRTELSEEQARTEAVSLLEHHYQAIDGYDSAYLDASGPEPDGLAQVIARMTSFFIERSRQAYLNWVWTTRVEAEGWPVRLAMAEIIIKRWGAHLPPRLADRPPAQLVNYLPGLLKLWLNSDQAVQGLFAPQKISSNF